MDLHLHHFSVPVLLLVASWLLVGCWLAAGCWFVAGCCLVAGLDCVRFLASFRFGCRGFRLGGLGVAGLGGLGVSGLGGLGVSRLGGRGFRTRWADVSGLGCRGFYLGGLWFPTWVLGKFPTGLSTMSNKSEKHENEDCSAFRKVEN